MTQLLKKLLPSLLIVGLILTVGYLVFQFGHKYGSLEVQQRWDQANQEAHQAIEEIRMELAEREQGHRDETARITHELAQAQKQHEVDLVGQRTAFEQRLLHSETRASVYQRRAEGGAAQCRDLAGHAARLDRALEEGRSLVRELGTTLGLRDRQLNQLGLQIHNDRRLIAGGANDR